jgi:uncharacterized protein (TIGR02996 family)
MRTFVYSDEKSHKFWSIDLVGTTFRVTFGKVGTAGQTQEKTFTDDAKAKKECEKLIAEKQKKGYVETSPKESKAVKPAATLREALEAAIQENPADLASHAAYADWLSEQSSADDQALGEFIQVQLALEDAGRTKAERTKLKAREKALLKAHETKWTGDWVDQVGDGNQPEGGGQHPFPEPHPVEFLRGLPARAVLANLGVNGARAFVASPQTRFVRHLSIGGYKYEESGTDYEPGEDTNPIHDLPEPPQTVLYNWPHFSNLRVFQLGWTSDEVYGDFCDFQCHLTGNHVHEMIKRMPHIEELYLFAHQVNGHRLFALPMPNLRILQMYHSLEYPLEKLAKNASLGRLTHLLIHPHAFEGDVACTLKGLKAIAKSPHLKSLTHLRLRLTVFGDDGVKEILNSGLIGRLKMLDLRHGRVTDAGAKLLADCPDVRKLQMLDLSRNELTKKGIAALNATGVPLQVEHQHESTQETDSEDYFGLEYLMQGDYE